MEHTLFTVSNIMFILLISLFACSEKTTDSSTSDAQDTASDSSDSSSDSSDSNEGMGEYIDGYCTYAVRCSLYASTDVCAEDISSQGWYDGCSIVDTAALDACLSWFSGLECSESGWIAECDEFYSCD